MSSQTNTNELIQLNVEAPSSHSEINSTVKSVANKSSGSSHDSLDSESGPPPVVERINLDCLSLLATNSHPEGLPCTLSLDFKAGSFNVVWFLEFNNGDQWVARVPQAPWSPMLERRMRSDMVGYNLIARRTSIPIPKIFAFFPGIDNVLGHPFTLMSRAKGVQLSTLWFDKEWFTDEHRRTFFQSLAENMSQLKDITFPKIGSLELLDDGGVLSVGSILPSWEDPHDQPSRDYHSWELPGPFVSVHAFLSTIIAQRTACAPSRDYQIQLALLRMFALSLLDPCLDDPPFVLSMPDFNYQNIFVTGDGRISCLIDWDGIEAVPIQGGYARYPSWMTRDWDPVMYGYPDESSAISEADRPSIPVREDLQEDPPSILQQFRNEYLVAYASVDPTGALVTRNSHIFEAIGIASSNWICLGGILYKLANYMFCPPNDLGILTAYDLESALKDASWLADCIMDAERFTPPSPESKAHWEMEYNSSCFPNK